jgi:hypothetical protein
MDTLNEPTRIYAIFHLNLAFSSIEEELHGAVIKTCYWPLLELCEQCDIPLAIELSVYTLDCIEQVDPKWNLKLRELQQTKRCEILAAGDSQIIGPLVPAKLNRANLSLGQTGYEYHIGCKPKIAYVNEQAISAGLLDIYIDTGFEAIVIEWDNPYSHNPEWKKSTLYQPQMLRAASGRTIPVIWNHAIAFQKFQRYAHGEYTQDEYLAYLKNNVPDNASCFSIYGNDAEIFDYRPGRFKTEGKREHAEWERIKELFSKLKNNHQYRWALPSQLLEYCKSNDALNFSNAAYPISVKKQAKYNITRWAVSGRNDIALNTQSFQQFKRIEGSENQRDWQDLCRAWASDLRTHLTDKRSKKIVIEAPKADLLAEVDWHSQDNNSIQLESDQKGKRIFITSKHVKLCLNTYRGLSIESLAFKDHEFIPIVGTLPHGHFDHIRYAADFYSNHTVIERYHERDRITDLDKTGFQTGHLNGNLVVKTHIPTELGSIIKYYIVAQKSVRCGYQFDFNERPSGSFRLGYMTLLDCSSRLWYAAHLGAEALETFTSDTDFDHGEAVSSLISSNSAVSATEGVCFLGNRHHAIKLSWQPSICAPVVMLSSKQVRTQYLNRLWFSLVEVDDTLKAGGSLPNFEYTIQATANEYATN